MFANLGDTTRDIQFAWAAGVLEGEGCFSAFKRKDRPDTVTTQILCEMTDKDVVHRLRDIFGCGNLTTRLNTSGRADKRVRKVSYIWAAQSKKDVLEVLLRVMPFLGERRLQKAHELLASVEARGYAS